MDRLKYDESHWSREEDAQKALDQYLRLGDMPFNRTKQDLLLGLAGRVAGKRILDYGGGAGYMAIPLAKAGASVTIVDAEANGLATAQYYAAKEGVEDRINTIHATEVPSELKGTDFDLIMAKDIVEHIEDDEAFLRDLAACQAASGTLVLSTQNSFSLNYFIEGNYNKYRAGNPNWCGWDPTHLRFYTSTSLGRKLARSGYRPARWASVYVVPYNIISWLTLLKLKVELPPLRFIDLTLGRIFPFNRTGWNIMVRAVRTG